MSAPTMPPFSAVLADLRAHVRALPEDLQLEASLAILHLSNLHGIAQRRQMSPQDQEHASTAFTAWLAGDPQH